jgi:hypothetical protein
MAKADGIAIGGGALVASLIDLLVERAVITKTDANIVIDRARARLVTFEPGHRIDASNFISSLAQELATRT